MMHEKGGPCCVSPVFERDPRRSIPATESAHTPAGRDSVALTRVDVPGGSFAMGDAFDEGYSADGERPVHPVHVSPYRLGATAVTNSEFGVFVEATGHVSDAEHVGWSAVFHLAATTAEPSRTTSAQAPWWVAVEGADWCHPEGRGSSLEGREDHPVVHVSHTDALAFCRWAGGRLPTEAEWEAAARGGHAGRRYPWGDELTPGGQHLCNIWQGRFPDHNTLADGHLTTAPVRSFPANDFGLHEMVGNAWEWCADWFSPGAYLDAPYHDPLGPDDGTTRVIRGGSYLCHDSYCHRYRVAARSHADPGTSTGNLGFRCAFDSD